MISNQTPSKFCKDDISKIENYDLAINDNKKWDLHHRLEFTINDEIAHSKEDLIRLDMYYNRPYFELIFLPRKDHIRLHNNGNKYRYNKNYKTNISVSQTDDYRSYQREYQRNYRKRKQLEV